MKKIVYFFALFSIITGCLDQIELDVPDDLQRSSLLIQGSLTKSETAQASVNIQILPGLDRFNAPISVISAAVNLRDEDGQTFPLPHVGEGLYEAAIPEAGNFQVEFFRDYQLQVTLSDGRTFESAPETLLPVPKISAIQTDSIVREVAGEEEGEVENVTFIEFYVDSPLRISEEAEKSRLRWEVYEAFEFGEDNPRMETTRVCYITQVLNRSDVKIYNGQTFSGEMLERHPLTATRLDFRFAEGYFVTVVQESLSAEAFTYWEQVQTVTERNGNMFDEPPGQIVNNLRSTGDTEQEVFGYFSVSAQDTARLYIAPESVGPPRFYCPLPPRPGIPPPPPTLCDSCLLWGPTSTYEQPEYWIQ